MVHTLRTGTLRSKAQSAAWALTTFPEPWRQLVAESPTWKNDPAVDVALNQQVQALIIWAHTRQNWASLTCVRMLAHSGPPRLFRSLRAPGPIPLAFLTTDANTDLWIPSCSPVR